MHCKGTDYAAFFSVQSAQKAKLYDKEAANANARLSTQLPYILAVSRFAHYLKAMMRDKIGSFMSRDDCQKFLQTVDHAVYDRRRQRYAGHEGEAPVARSQGRGCGRSRQAGRLSRRLRSCGRTSSWMNFRFRCGWLPICPKVNSFSRSVRALSP